MNIRVGAQQTHRASSTLAKLDRSLAQGVLPQNVHILEGSKGADARVLDRAQEDTIELTDGSEKVEEYKSHAFRRKAQFGIGAMAMALPGALLGTVGVPGNPILGAAIGAGVGMIIHWDANHRHTEGTISTALDGVETRREWVGQPENHVKTPAELRTILHSTGVLGDSVIPQANIQFKGAPKADVLESLASHKSTLKGLSDDRRLLGKLGGKTRYGKDALQVITAATARELLSRGESVTLLTLGEVKDTNHNFSSKAYSGAYSKKSIEDYQYTERKLDYQLDLIKSVQDLEEVREGEGLPATAVGVPVDSSSFTQTVTKSETQGSREFVGKQDTVQTRFSQAMLGDQKSPVPSGTVARSLNSMVNPSTLGYTAVGAMLGATVGSGVPGLDAGAAATIGGVVGHLAGRAAVSRAAKDDRGQGWSPNQTNSMGRWATIGAGVVVGAGLGVLGSQASGNAGEVSALAIGSFGGGATGLLAGNPWGNVDRAMMTGGLGFIAGSGFGVAKMFGVDGGLATTVALGALGGVLGGATAALATRAKA